MWTEITVCLIVVVIIIVSLTVYFTVDFTPPEINLFTIPFETGNLGSPCFNTPCNTGLSCDVSSYTCKQDVGSSCFNKFDCAGELLCGNNICITGTTGGLNDPCPCQTGYWCVEGLCLGAAGSTCTLNSDCANGLCQNNICTVGYPNGYAACTNASQCNSGICENNICAAYSGFEFGVPGAPCGEGLVGYPSASCGDNFVCRGQEREMGICTALNRPLLQFCDAANICGNNMTCLGGMCRWDQDLSSTCTSGLFQILFQDTAGNFGPPGGSSVIGYQQIALGSLNIGSISDIWATTDNNEVDTIYVVSGNLVYRNQQVTDGSSSWTLFSTIPEASSGLSPFQLGGYGTTIFVYSPSSGNIYVLNSEGGISSTYTVPVGSSCVDVSPFGDILYVNSSMLYLRTTSGTVIGNPYLSSQYSYRVNSSIPTWGGFYTMEESIEDSCNVANYVNAPCNINYYAIGDGRVYQASVNINPVVFFAGDYTGYFLPEAYSSPYSTGKCRLYRPLNSNSSQALSSCSLSGIMYQNAGGVSIPNIYYMTGGNGTVIPINSTPDTRLLVCCSANNLYAIISC